MLSQQQPAGGGWLLRLLMAPLMLACLWLGGLLQFIASLPMAEEAGNRHTEGVVVLTGGRDRIETGLKLLQARRADKLLISGVDRNTTPGQLRQASGAAAELFACCVELGREARDTLGNAIEAQLWVRRQGIRSLSLVTASFHMPRSLLLFQRALPQVEIVAHPVLSERQRLGQWWRHPATAGLLAGEFNKYLLVLLQSQLAGLPV
ncbi:MAG: YdcF family protein [Alphaproteobacteria bacterium]|nr:YdcF family protein [Alphaproteobacteria bacterium]